MLPEIYLIIPSYALMAAIGLFVAVLFVFFRMDSVGMSFADLIAYMLCCAVFAVILARIVFVIAMIPSMDVITLGEIMYYLLYGGIVFYGGLFGVLIGVIVVSKIKGRHALPVLNMIAPAIPLFHCFARIGCLLAGCCYGIPWMWGVIMENEPYVVRFPVQLIESICNIFIFCLIMIYSKIRKSDDDNLKIYLCTYAVCRFILEFFRGDTIRGKWVLGLSTAQIISLGILFAYIVVSVKKRKT
ncbi:MAG: prolipoprotein diacylglyceryl transferase [Eubacteriales bacterium]|nr:prolipoprotein diacylglyceryl transferase [Eubacteriales bacterium]